MSAADPGLGTSEPFDVRPAAGVAARLGPDRVDERVEERGCAISRPLPARDAGEPDTDAETDTATLTRLGRPWNVIVHDDPVTLMSYVVEVFREVFGYDERKARKLMLEVHENGRSVVWTGDREQAEVYVTKLQARHLLATLERVED